MEHEKERPEQLAATPVAAPSTEHEPAGEVSRTPSAPVPVPVAPSAVDRAPSTGVLSVGHAEDRAEADADAHADRALSRLASITGETHQHGPGCDHVRRSARVPSGSGAPVVGHEGGDLDTATSNAINARRGSGAALESGVLQRMETAFDTDLSGVRVHTDTTAAKLNHAVSARAFTTGQDIFFGAGEYAPQTPGGAKVLAHEIAHTLQNGPAIHRLNNANAATATAITSTVTAQTISSPLSFTTVTGLPVGALSRLTTQQWLQIDLLGSHGPIAVERFTPVAATLLGVLKSGFGLEWNTAKEALVFGHWPGQAPIDAARSLRVMKALTSIRGYVHGEVRKSLGLATNQMEFKGSVGADTVTSDVDVSTAGTDTETGVGSYNTMFRQMMGTAKDPGSVFDLNVYAMDFIHGFTTTVTPNLTLLTPNAEVADADLDPKAKAARDDAQETWSMVHMARFLDQDDWDGFVTNALKSSQDPKKDKMLFLRARLEASRFHSALYHRAKELTEAEPALGALQVGPLLPDSISEPVLMRAANSLYEETLLKVKALRTEIATVQKTLNDTRQSATKAPDQQTPDDTTAATQHAAAKTTISTLSLKLLEQTSWASLYANEVYGSGDAVLHAVIGAQIGRKKQADAHAQGNTAMRFDVVLTPRQWMNSFNDNAGDVLKDFEHLASGHGNGPTRHWWAAFKMGKYAERMMDAFGQLVRAQAFTPAQQTTLTSSGEYQRLQALGQAHLRVKAGVGATDPAQVVNDQHFMTFQTPASTKAIKTDTLKFVADVRSMASL